MNRIGRCEALVMLAIGSIILGARPVGAEPQSTTAVRVLGQHGLSNNMINFGGPAALNNPEAVAIDHSVTPNRVYVVDSGNNRVLGYADETKLINGAPADLVIGQPDFYSAIVNKAHAGPATLYAPVAATVDHDGNLYVADQNDNRVLEYDAPFAACAGVFPCVNGGAQRVIGQADFSWHDCVLPTAANVCLPAGVAVDSAENLYVVDSYNNRVLEFTSPVKAIASGNSDTTPNLVFGQGGSFTSNACTYPVSPDTLCFRRTPGGGPSYNYVIAIDGSDNLWVPEGGRALEYLRPVALGGGNPGTPGSPGDTTADFSMGGGLNGEDSIPDPCDDPSASSFCEATAVAIDSAGNIFVRDEDDLFQTISLNYGRVLGFDNPFAPSSAACPGCGDSSLTWSSARPNFTTAACTDDIDASTLSCSYPDAGGDPIGLAIDDNGSLFAGDSGDNRVLKYSPLSSQIADLVLGQQVFTNSAVNQLDARGFTVVSPQGVAVDTSSPDGPIYVADAYNNRVLGWRSAAGFNDGATADIIVGQPDAESYRCDAGTLPVTKELCLPLSVAVDPRGNLYIADNFNGRVVVYHNPIAACSSFPCMLSNIESPERFLGTCGSPSPFNCRGGGPTAENMDFPAAVAVDHDGNVFVSDDSFNRVLEYFDPLARGGGTPGKPGHAGDTTADLVFGQGSSGTNFKSFACSGGPGPSGGDPSLDGLCAPNGIAVDGSGNLFVSDQPNSRVVEYTKPRKGHVTATRVFGGIRSPEGFCADGSPFDPPPSADSLCQPAGVAVDANGNVYVADTANSRMLEFFQPDARGGGTPGTPGAAGDTTADVVFGQTSFTSNGCNQGITYSSFVNGVPTGSSLCFPTGIAFDALSNLYVTDTGNARLLAYNAASVDAQLSFSPKPLSFGTVKQGTTRMRRLIIRNSAGSATVALTGATASSPFSIQKQCTGLLGPARVCEMVVGFTPSETIPYAGMVTIESNAASGPLQVPLAGTGFTR